MFESKQHKMDPHVITIDRELEQREAYIMSDGIIPSIHTALNIGLHLYLVRTLKEGG